MPLAPPPPPSPDAPTPMDTLLRWPCSTVELQATVRALENFGYCVILLCTDSHAICILWSHTRHSALEMHGVKVPTDQSPLYLSRKNS